MNNEKTSTEKRWIILLFIIVLTILIGGFIAVQTYLESYYINKKVKAMDSVYKEMNAASQAGTIDSAEFADAFRNICEKNNVNIIILDEATQTLKASSQEYEIMIRTLLGYIFDKTSMEEDTLLNQNDRYEIRRIKENDAKYEYLDMWGTLDDGNVFLVRCPLEGIKDSVNTARTFLSYIIIVLVALLIISTVIAWRRSTISELREQNIRLQRDIMQKEKMESMRSEFLSNVSHELKTPIALVQGYAEGLKENVNSDDESRDFYCDVIIDEASKMNGIVKKLMDINQLEFGETPFTYEEFDLSELMEEYLQSVNILMDQKNVKLIKEIPAGLYVNADRYYTMEVVDNYFTNALNHVSGDKNIIIRAVKNLNETIVSVYNSGDPIPEESIPHIWEKFYKVDKARTREYGGSGVGLSVVKAILDKMHQRYGVTNKEGGVEFFFTLTNSEGNAV